jgi:hypothetical protein
MRKIGRQNLQQPLIAAPKPKKKRKSNLTPGTAALIGVLLRLPNAQLVGNDKQMAERLVKLGWLRKDIGKKPEKAGVYEYEVNVPIYVPTEEGLALYNEKATLLKAVPPNMLNFLSRLSNAESRLYNNYSSRIKAEEKKSAKK